MRSKIYFPEQSSETFEEVFASFIISQTSKGVAAVTIRINVYITILSVLALIGGIILAVQLESFLVFLYVAIGTSVVYCFFRMLTVIAHLLADIKENTTPNRKGNNAQSQKGNKKR